MVQVTSGSPKIQQKTAFIYINRLIISSLEKNRGSQEELFETIEMALKEKITKHNQGFESICIFNIVEKKIVWKEFEEEDWPDHWEGYFEAIISKY